MKRSMPLLKNLFNLATASHTKHTNSGKMEPERLEYTALDTDKFLDSDSDISYPALPQRRSPLKAWHSVLQLLLLSTSIIFFLVGFLERRSAVSESCVEKLSSFCAYTASCCSFRT